MSQPAENLNVTGVVPVHPEKMPWWTVWLQELIPQGLGNLIEQHPGYEIEDVVQAIAEARMGFFVALSDGCPDAGVIYQVQTFPRTKTLWVLFVGGDNFKRWRREIDDMILRYAKLTGATHMSALGRAGWRRHYPDAVVQTYYTVEVI